MAQGIDDHSYVLAVSAALAVLAANVGDFESVPGAVEITGGDPVGVCGWPSAVWMQGCSGTLVDPFHVVYAAHCGEPASVFLGEDANEAGGRTVPVEACWSYPGGGPGDGNDFAVCRLALAVDDVPIIPPLMGCEASLVQPGHRVTVVGYGLTPDGDFGRKHAVTTTFHGFNDVGEASIGGGGKDSCQGDSGGPAFVELPDGGGWRFFGITSYGESDCASGGFYAVVHQGMPWLEDATARDLTPCTDANGTWSPDPRCDQVPLHPAQGGGDWDLSCSAGAVTGALATCGDPFALPPDADAPDVAIANPPTGTEFATQVLTGVAMVDVAVDAADVGWGVQWVELHADGEPLRSASDFLPPFAFAHAFAPGVYELEAVAFDFAGNVTRSQPVWIGVDESPPAIPSPDAEGGEGCGCRRAPAGGWWSILLLVAARRRRMIPG